MTFAVRLQFSVTVLCAVFTSGSIQVHVYAILNFVLQKKNYHPAEMNQCQGFWKDMS